MTLAMGVPATGTGAKPPTSYDDALKTGQPVCRRLLFEPNPLPSVREAILTHCCNWERVGAGVGQVRRETVLRFPMKMMFIRSQHALRCCRKDLQTAGKRSTGLCHFSSARHA